MPCFYYFYCTTTILLLLGPATTATIGPTTTINRGNGPYVNVTIDENCP